MLVIKRSRGLEMYCLTWIAFMAGSAALEWDKVARTSLDF